MKTLLSRFMHDEGGATAIEYGLIAAGIAVVIITAVSEAGRRSPVLRGLPAFPKPFRLDALAHVVRSLCG